MKIKILSLTLILIMLMSLMASCNEKNNNKEKIEYDGIVIDDEYTVIRGDKASKTDIRSAAYLRDQINSAVSANVGLKTDFYKKKEEISEKEILVGKTNRETEFDRSTLKEGEYYIGIEGTKIIVDAYDAEALHFAVREFASKWLTKDLGIQEDGTLLMNEEICNSLNGLDITVKNSIVILTQNILAVENEQTAANSNMIVDRAPRFKKLVDQYQPDIIGLQEDSETWRTYLNKYFRKEYGIVNDDHHNRILYKLDRFELLDSGRFWLSKTPHKESKVEASFQARFCTWALLKDKQTGETFLMCNTHLDHGPDIAREQQSEILINYIKENFPDYPIYITADYNFEPTSKAYKIVSDEYLDAHDEALIDRSTTQLTFPATEGKPTKEIDFCFYNDKSTVVSYHILTDTYNGCVSDHYGVLFEFVIN